jgi:hypothetical protein
VKAVIGQNQPDGPKESMLHNCHLIVKNDEPEPYLFYFGDNGAVVRLDGYLICPLDMFTQRQRKVAVKKYADRFPKVRM